MMTTQQQSRPEYVRRFVVTHLSKTGMRTLAHAAQGRHTYASREEAQTWIDAAQDQNGARLAELFGLPLQVRGCACYPVHFDPVSVWFPDEDKGVTL